MGISSREAAAARFAGTATSYDAVQVDAYVARVAATLAAQERALEEVNAEIRRLEHALDVAHAVQARIEAQPAAAGSVLGKAVVAAGAADTTVVPPLSTSLPNQTQATPVFQSADHDSIERIEAWVARRDAQAVDRAELRAAYEEVRRRAGKSNALAAEAAVARHLNRKRLIEAAETAADTAVTIHLEAAGDEAALVLQHSLAEADRIVAEADRAATERTRAAQTELADLNRKMKHLRVAISHAGTSLDALAETTKTEIAVVEDIIDLGLHAGDDGDDLRDRLESS